MADYYPVPANIGRPSLPATEVYTHEGRHRRAGWGLDDAPYKEPLVVEVGLNGDFPSINKALEALSRAFPAYVWGGVNIELRLLSGFVMQEQIFAHRINLGGVVITSEDPEVTIARSSLTKKDQSGDLPAFYANENAVLPVIGTRFNMDTSGPEGDQIGIRVSMNSAVVVRVVPLTEVRNGIINATRRGINIQQGSLGVLNSADFSGAGNVGIRLANGSRAQASNAIARDCGDAGASIASSTIDLGKADLSGCLRGMGLRADNGSVVAFYDALAAGCATNSVFAIEGSMVGARNLAGTDCGTDAIFSDSAFVDARSADTSRSGGFGARVEGGGVINATDFIGSVSQIVNLSTGKGIICDGSADSGAAPASRVGIQPITGRAMLPHGRREASAAPLAGRVYAFPMTLTRKASLVSVTLAVTAAGDGAAVTRVAIVGWNNGDPSGAPLLADLGSVSGTTTGTKVLTLASTIEVPERFWVVTLTNGQTSVVPTMVSMSSTEQQHVTPTSLTASGGVMVSNSGNDGAMPNPLPTLATPVSSGPATALRFA